MLISKVIKKYASLVSVMHGMVVIGRQSLLPCLGQRKLRINETNPVFHKPVMSQIKSGK